MSSLEYEIYKEGGLLNGKYQKLENISKGAYGIVTLAKDIHKSRLVAVKYIFKADDEGVTKKVDMRFSKSLTAKKMDDDICEEALHEIAIHEKLGIHPSIISFLDCFNSFIILEYCSRGDLYEAIKNDIGPTSTRDVVNVILQVIDAVEFAHSKSIYHRDIKPENILIADDWSVRLSDWGLASVSRYCNEFGVGSERYMAPEMFDEPNVQIYDAAKCDIWSIGICLLNLVFKKSPFNVANQTDKAFSYFACNREALFDVFESMSLDLFKVLRHSLTIDPDNRDLGMMKKELLSLQSLTIDDDFKQYESEMGSRAQSAEVKPIAIKENVRAAKNNYFATATPNVNINNHYKNFKQDGFRRKDFFTPPSANAQFMEKLEKKKGIYHPPHQRGSSSKITPHNWAPANKKPPRKQRNSFHAFTTHSSGKYVPPSLRSPQLRSMKSPLQVPAVDSLVFDDDDDDTLFVLEETETSNSTVNDLNRLGENFNGLHLEESDPSDMSSVSSLLPPGAYDTAQDSLSSATFTRDSSPNQSTGSSSSETNTDGGIQKKVYVPPHHRSDYQPELRKHWNHNNKMKYNSNHHVGYRGRRHSMSSKKDEASVSSSVPVKKTDWFKNRFHSNKNNSGQKNHYNGQHRQFNSNHNSRFKVTTEEEDDELFADDDSETGSSYANFASRVGQSQDFSYNAANNHQKAPPFHSSDSKHSNITTTVRPITSGTAR